MTLFWIVAAALVAAALAALLRPLMKPARAIDDNSAETNLRVLRAQLAEVDAEHAAGRLDDGQRAAACADIERRVLEEVGSSATPPPAGARFAGRGAMVGLALALPATALALYLHLGSREALEPAAHATSEHAALQDMDTAIARLTDKLKAHPDDADGWALLGRSYALLGRFEAARDAYASALKHGREDAPLLADFADAMAMAQGRQFSPETDRLLARALALDPDHLKSLALAGAAAMSRGDHATAVRLWARARDQAPPDSELAQGLAASISEAQGRASAAPLAASESRPLAAAATASGLRVAVSVAPALTAKVQPGDTVFVFARAAEGPRMPLAIARLNAAALPAQVQLDDTMAMTPQARLSAFERVVVTARVSKKGSATPEAGDLEGESAPLAPSGSASVTIDRVRP